MLKIRLQRVGRKHETAFRLVLTDSKNSTKSGRFKEILGSYDPRKTTESIKADRVKHWLSKGASATDSVHNFLVSNKVIDSKKKNVLPKKTVAPKESEAVKEASPEPEVKAEEVTPEAPAAETAPEATPETPVETPAEAVVESPVEPEASPVEPEAPDAAPQKDEATQ